MTATEDLGGGLRATAVMNIEAGANNSGRGNPTFASDALNNQGNIAMADRSVSLAGGFGTVAFALTRSSDLAVGANVAPISLKEAQYDAAKVFTRSVQTVVGYTSPEVFPGLRVNVARSFAGNTDESQKGATNVFGATYAAGPLTAAVAFKQRNSVAVAALVTGGLTGAKKNTTELNATYDFGVAKVGAGWSSKVADAGKAATTFGVSAPVASNITVGLNYGKRDKNKYQDIGVKYDLSKRTNVQVAYGTYNTGSGKDKNQSRIRVEHNF